MRSALESTPRPGRIAGGLLAGGLVLAGWTLLALAAGAAPARAVEEVKEVESAGKAEQAEEGDRILVEVHGVLRTGIVAIGGETTGVVIESKNVTWELDLGESPKLREKAEQLDGKRVVVKGEYRLVEGVEIPQRHIVKVQSLEPAR